MLSLTQDLSETAGLIMLLGHDSKSDMRLLGQCCYLLGMPTTLK